MHQIEEFLLHERKAGKHMLTMQDVSNWQGERVPELVAKHEVLAIKATEGNSFLDPEFADNWKFAKDNEKARIAYCLIHPSLPGLQQANTFLDYIDHSGGIESGDMFALDLEVTDGKAPEIVDACAAEWLDHVASQTKANPFVYTYIYFAEAGNCKSLGHRPLWIADPSHPPAHPVVPKPWDNWEIHQYGVFRGIDADVVKAQSVEQLAQFGALVGPPAPPPNTTVMHLSDGGAKMQKDFNDKTPIEALKGQKFTAGNAVLEFE